VGGVGAGDSQGPRAQQSDKALSFLGLTGAGVTVGVISDSFGNSTSDVASGDLPTHLGFPVQVPDPGPDTFDQASVSVPGGFGRPSSVALPARFADAGSVTDWFVPAPTTGGWFVAPGGFTVIVTSALVDSALSLAVRRST